MMIDTMNIEIPENRMVFRYVEDTNHMQLHRIITINKREIQIKIGLPISWETYSYHRHPGSGDDPFIDRLLKFTAEEWELFKIQEILEGRGVKNV